MAVIENMQAFKYNVGEEVVVRLEPGAVIETSGLDLPTAALPPWTIAEITGRESAGGRPAYTITFTLEDDRVITVVPESAIEGTA